MHITYRLRVALFALAFCTLSFGATLDGIFTGKMTLKKRNGQPYDVPLAIALSPTGETLSVARPSGTTQQEPVIDGAFVIDEEGGPYSFTKVSYRPEENGLDLRYDRPDNDSKERSSSFRLFGTLDAQGNYTGRVVSGNFGPIGTFVLTPSDLDILPVREKYVGVWSGATTIGGSGVLSISIVPSPVQTTNPTAMEFEYTPGRLASVSYQGTGYQISEVIFDYLRHRMYLIQRLGERQTLVFQAEYYPDTQKIWGFAGGGSAARTGTFTLEKEPDSKK